MRWSRLVGSLAVLFTAGAQSCPEVDPAAVTLAAATARMLCLEPQMARTAAERRQAEATADERRAAMASTWSASAGSSVSTSRIDGDSQSRASGSARLNLQRTLVDGGARSLRLNSARALATASEYGEREKTLDLQLEFVGLWLDARAAEADLASALVARGAAAASLVAAEARFASGSATQVDVLQARSAFVQAEREVQSSGLARVRLLGVLAQRLGWPPHQAIGLAGNDAAALGVFPGGPGSAEQPMEQHPKLLAQAQRVLAQRELLEAARADAAGVLSLNGQLGPDLERNKLGSAPSASRHGATGSIGLTWSWTFSDGGARRAAIDRAQAQLDAAQASEAADRLRLSEGLWQARAEREAAEVDLVASRAALDAAQAAEAAQRGRYAAGVGNVSELLTAQTQLAERRLQVTRAEQHRLRTQARWLAAAGLAPVPSTPPLAAPR